MKNTKELQIINHEIVQTEDKIYIKNFDKLQEKVNEIAKEIEQAEVTEESMKEVKQVLANVNKDIKIANDLKIKLKKEILNPFQYFENQVKELIETVKTSENIARQKLKELEEKDIQKKREAITKLFEKRNNSIYHFLWLSIDSFMKREYLNKTYTMNKIENEMVSFFEKIKTDLDVIDFMENPYEGIFLDYQKSLNIGEILKKNESLKKFKKEPKLPCEISIIVTNSEKLNEISNLLEKEKIKYTMKFV